MRPGPGLVVMALAFISGARRGTSQQSSATTTHQQQQPGSKLGTFEEDNTEALSRINPWLSACDLAQPNSAPDLQGQCSAGTLPVAWINEGPGPPRCPPPCKDTKSNNKNSNRKANPIDNTKYNMENRLHDKQQCLDYLGDPEEFSPAQICKKSSQSIETKLRALRLRHCCERTAISALHNAALAAVLTGGDECVQTLEALADSDELARRITCEFVEVLQRYDCGQAYSIIHHCGACKEAYRRWGCGMLLPYFGTRDDLVSGDSSANSSPPEGSGSGSGDNGAAGGSGSTRSSSPSSSAGGSGSSSGSSSKSVNNKSGNDGDRAAHGNSMVIYRGSASNKQTEPNLNDANKQQLVKNISITVKSSRRKTQRVRIRPCLELCQTVEQKCPYMLPGDRAPAYPTQYAGEPTFLCRDLNIEETGEQLRKSNNGPDECCFGYCDENPHSGTCTRCDPLLDADENYWDDAENVDDGDDGGGDKSRNRSPPRISSSSANATAGNSSSSSISSSSSSSSSSTTLSTSRRRSKKGTFLDELRRSSELPPRLASCPPIITSATSPSSSTAVHCRATQLLLLQQQQQQLLEAAAAASNPSSPTPTHVASTSKSPLLLTTTTTTSTTTPGTPTVASSASSLAKPPCIKSIVHFAYFSSSSSWWRWLDELAAWTKILLQLAGL